LALINTRLFGLGLAVIGVALLLFCVGTSFFVGEPFFNERAHEVWHMNNYLVVPGFVAFVCFAFVPWLLGGFFVGVVVCLVFGFKRDKRLLLLGAFAVAIVCCTLGFNTFDMMLGCFYWTDGVDPAPIMLQFGSYSFGVNAWNYYFFLFLVPLFTSGFCFGVAVLANYLKLKL